MLLEERHLNELPVAPLKQLTSHINQHCRTSQLKVAVAAVECCNSINDYANIIVFSAPFQRHPSAAALISPHLVSPQPCIKHLDPHPHLRNDNPDRNNTEP